jgi:proteasome accessory factor B
VQGPVTTTSKPGAFEVPPGTDIRELTATLAPEPAERTATLLVRSGAGHGLRRHARPATEPGERAGWDLLELDYGNTAQLADEVVGYGADVVVEAPEDLRAVVVDRLRGALAAVR